MDLPAGQKLRPDFGLHLEFGTHSPHGDGDAVAVHTPGGGSSFDVRQRFKVARGLALEVRGVGRNNAGLGHAAVGWLAGMCWYVMLAGNVAAAACTSFCSLPTLA